MIFAAPPPPIKKNGHGGETPPPSPPPPPPPPKNNRGEATRTGRGIPEPAISRKAIDQALICAAPHFATMKLRHFTTTLVPGATSTGAAVRRRRTNLDALPQRRTHRLHRDVAPVKSDGRFLFKSISTAAVAS